LQLPLKVDGACEAMSLMYKHMFCYATTVCRAKARYPHVRFEHMDGFDIDALSALSPTGTYGEQ
jgi:hypothetical protein